MSTHPKIFITGIYRSGTTLISRILNNHSRLWVTYDSVHFMRFSYEKYSPLTKNKNVEKLVNEVAERLKRRWKMTLDIPVTLERIFSKKILSYGLIYDEIMKTFMVAHKPKATGWGEKTNVCWGSIPKFLKMFPSGKVIHIIRDPRDVMCSYRNMTYEPGYRYLDTAFCALSAFQSVDLHQQMFSPTQFYLLRYESLLNQPKEEMKKICYFLEIDFENQMLSADLFMDKSGHQWTGDSSFESSLKTISTNPIGRWKQHAKPFDLYILEMLNLNYLIKYHYPKSQVSVNSAEVKKILDIILQDSLLRSRYETWLKTGQGTEAYPSDPLMK